jgi:hypothetical protein
MVAGSGPALGDQMHVIAWLLAGYARFIWWLVRVDWWLLHRWWFLAGAMTYDLIRYGIWPQIRRLLWQRKLTRQAGL